MTAILVDRRHGLMMGDRYVTNAEGDRSVLAEPKVFRHAKCLVGFSDAMSGLHVVRRAVSVAKLRAILKAEQCAEALFLVLDAKGIWTGDHSAVYLTADTTTAIGSGGPTVLAAYRALLSEGVPAQHAAMRAFEECANVTPSVGPPFDLVLL